MEIRAERGLATTELAILFPIVMAVVLSIMHVALWSHANAVAQAAAEHGAEVAAAFGADPDEGRVAAEEFVERAGQVGDAIAVVSMRAADVTVTVSGTYPSIFGRLEVSASSTLVIERIGAP